MPFPPLGVFIAALILGAALGGLARLAGLARHLPNAVTAGVITAVIAVTIAHSYL